MIKECDQLVKLILIGSSGVGKSSILLQFADNKFNQHYLTTIGIDFRFKTMQIDGKTIRFEISDTAGQERFRTITSAYYKGADAVIIVYDITDAMSFADIAAFWVPEVETYARKGIDILILGNKSDCERRVPLQKAMNYAKIHNYDFEQVSAKTADKITETLRDFGKKIANKKAKKSQQQTNNIKPTVDLKPVAICLDNTKEQKLTKKPCC